MTAKEKLKTLMDTGEFDFVKEISKENLWKLLFLAAFMSDTARFTQPERKTGQWLPDNRPGGGFWVCSCCKFPSEAFAADKLYKFCPNCGADMKGEQE